MTFMEKKGIILYIHGMGGGGDSRIPSVLNGHIDECSDGLRRYEVVVRTYSFDPDTAWKQICSWVEELGPELVIGESLGSLNAMKISGLPHVSHRGIHTKWSGKWVRRVRRSWGRAVLVPHATVMSQNEVSCYP